MATASTKKAAGPLDSFFHYTSRGGTLGGEVVAGITMAVLSVCGMFMNMQLVLQYLTTDYYSAAASDIATSGEIVAITWVAAMIVAAVGTLAMGLVARLPLVQVTSLSLTTTLVGTLSVSSGLTYYNMLAIVFVSNLAYLAVAAVPALRKFFVDALPRPVRLALPAAAGLLMAWVAAQLSGVFVATGRGVVSYGSASIMGTGTVALSDTPALSGYSYLTDLYHPQMLLSVIACLLAVAVYLFGARKVRKTPFTNALVWGTVFFLVASVVFCGVNWNNMKMSLSFLWARLWMVGSEDALQAHLGTAFANLQVGKVFTQGFDFSGFAAEGGNVALVFASTLLNYVFLFLYDAQSTVDGCDLARRDDERSDSGIALIVNAVTNVLASVLSVAPVAVGKESVAGTRDRARSGLASVVAALVMLASVFVWIIPALMATITSYSVNFNMYGHYGKVLQLLTYCSFSVADVVMMLVGLFMAARSLEKGVSGTTETAPYLATIAGTLLLSNLACGVACGMVAHVLVQLARGPRRKGQKASTFVERVGGTKALVLAAVLAVVLVLSVAA